MAERTDSRHWSQRWLRCAQVGSDAVMLYDLYQALDIPGCGRGKCTDRKNDASTRGRRYRVTRFWGMEICPSCGRAYDYANGQETMYLGDSLSEATSFFDAAEVALFAS